MKRLNRLQFRHRNEIFENRAQAAAYFEKISNDQLIDRDNFGESLYAEPLVAKYFDEEGKQQIIFAIGVDSGYTKYHIIDSKEIAESIEAEIVRAMAAELSLSGSVDTEIVRAMAAELSLSGSVDTERAERIDADTILQTQITENIAKIVPVTENLGANVREEYVLKNAKGEELGSHIKVYKDSALVGAEVNYKGATGVTINEEGEFEFNYSGEVDKSVEYLYLIYRNENGGLSLVSLDFENFLMENEEGLGIKIVDHKITIKIKSGEKYLTVTEDGLQTIKIDEAIKDAVDASSDNLTAKIDAEIERSTEADDYISGLTSEFSAATVEEFIITNSAITVEKERAMAAESSLSASVETETARALKAELFLSGYVDTERTERIQKDRELDAEIAGIKDVNTALDKKIDIEVTRSINEDENFRIQLDHLSSDVNTEIVNRENADNAIRTDFAAADIALGSRIDTVITDRDSADQFLSDRIDNEATTRKDADDLLTTTINGVSERVAFIEADYLVYQDKADVLMAVSGAQNVAIEAVNAAAFAQTTADEAKAKVEGFMAAAEIGGAAIDTLIEIQNYIKTDGAAAADMLDSIAENKTAIETEVNRAKSVEKILDDAIKAEVTARTESINILSAALATEITRAIGAETVNATAISNEAKRAADVEAALQTAITTEINNRESADNSIRDAFAAADESLKARIAAEELARQTAYDALNTRIDNEATTRAGAVAALTTEITNGDNAVREALQAETTNRETADATLLSDIQAETKNREDADATLLNAIQVETTNREAADATLLSAIQSETKNREDADANLANLINQEVSTRTQDVLSIGTKLTTLEGVDSALDTKVNTLSASVLTEINTVKNAVMSEITSAFTIDDTKVLEASKIYADDAVKVAVDGINAKKVNDVSYDNGNKKIYLSFADGTVSNGFDASEFVVDGMLDEVEFNEHTNNIKFIWNTASEKTEINVPLDKFVDQYKVADDSVSYLKISDDNKISAIVDGADNYVKTLATNVYVEQKCNEIYNNVNESMSAYVTTLESKITALENKITTLENNMEQMVKDVIKSYLVGVEKEIAVNEINGKLTVGFSDDAIFGEF